ncbi:hypothetical protein OXPF_27910 [Oxobacter pfennigii]|uniref:ECF transporter S component n=1 Tax=Oxobacter pfennigii TaxID=36849 RepID=A0A0P8WY95_9CLOT|nr:ECF transporter S component [Oxobacter pfennigii]KPU43350.1 hypothetical protein OXPF_27910 [Oxobacter pfennigii]
MKRKIKPELIIILFFAVILFLVTYFNVDAAVSVLISCAAIMVSFVIIFEMREIDAKTICILATISAIIGVLRVPFAAIPGVQPVTFMCAVTGYSMGSVNGFMVGAMSAFISNFFLGHGPWTLWQMMGWGLCGAFFGAFKKPIKSGGINVFILLCGLWGYIYGFILNQWYLLQYIRPVTLKAILIGSILSFSYDSMHALGNIVFSRVFGKSFIEVLERYNRRNKIVRIMNDNETESKVRDYA